MKLTARQREILDFVTVFIEREGYSPSMQEIAAHFGFASVNAAYKHLEALKARGFLTRDANKARSIEVSPPSFASARALPLYGYVAAGQPIEAISSPAEIAVPEEFLSGPRSYYVLQVRGESMIEEHIRDGDYVIVEARELANNGEMVIALVDGENTTLKWFFRENGRIRLQPSNANLSPLFFEESRVKIQGVVVGVMRKYR